jgi:hypothetical protein
MKIFDQHLKMVLKIYLSNSVGRGWSKITGCWGDDGCRWGWDCWWSNWNCNLARPWFSSNVGIGRLLLKGLSSNYILVASQHLLSSDLTSKKIFKRTFK